MRVVLAGVWIFAAVQKLPDPAGFVRAVRAYDVLPDLLVRAIGYGLPVLELGIGIVLLLGIGTRVAAGISGLLFLAFVIGIIQASARGVQIDCGCFGGGGTLRGGQTTSYTVDILRDVGLLILAAYLLAFPVSRWALDDFLRRGGHHDVRAERVGPRRTKEAQRRMAELAAKRQREASRRMALGSGAVALALVVVGFAGIGIQAHVAKVGGPLLTPRAAADSGLVVGKKTAPVTVDLYEDFICPACGAFEKGAGATVAKLAASGQAKFRYHMLGFLDQNSTPAGYSTRAANAAACVSDGGAFTRFHALLYANQPAEGSPGRSTAQLYSVAKKAGATDPSLKGCIEGGTYKRWVAKITDQASKDGVTQTPTIRIGGTDVTGPNGASPGAADLQKAVAAAAAKAARTSK